MSFETNVSNLATRMATEAKSLRTLINGNLADLTGLSTTAKTNLVAAINEVKAAADAAGESGGATNLDQLSDVQVGSAATGHILRHNGTQFVNVLGSDHFQPTDSDLTAIAALTTTAYGRAFLELANQAALMGLLASASDTVKGIVELATTAEATTGSDTTRAVTPAGLKAVADTKVNTSSLAAVATSGSAADLTGTLPTSVLPPLAVNEVFTVADQAAMLALTAQRGDMAIRSDNGRTYVLSADAPATLSNWKEVMAAGQVQSVAGKTGIVSLVKADVGLGNVDNTSDASKVASGPIKDALDGKQNLDSTLTALAGLSTASNQMIYSTGADAFSMTSLTAFARTLLDDADAATARATLSVYSQAEIGNPETNFVSVFEAGLV